MRFGAILASSVTRVYCFCSGSCSTLSTTGPPTETVPFPLVNAGISIFFSQIDGSSIFGFLGSTVSLGVFSLSISAQARRCLQFHSGLFSLASRFLSLNLWRSNSWFGSQLYIDSSNPSTAADLAFLTSTLPSPTLPFLVRSNTLPSQSVLVCLTLTPLSSMS